jgi:hypothetical protein
LPAAHVKAPAAGLEKNDQRCRSRGASFDYRLKGEHAMQYLLVCCFDETQWAQMPKAPKDRMMQEYSEFIQSVVQSGHYRTGALLQPTSMATTVREKHGKSVTTDGPFAETKDQLGGYHMVECQDLDQPRAIARHIPTLRVGGAIEVRPVMLESEL